MSTNRITEIFYTGVPVCAYMCLHIVELFKFPKTSPSRNESGRFFE